MIVKRCDIALLFVGAGTLQPQSPKTCRRQSGYSLRAPSPQLSFSEHQGNRAEYQLSQPEGSQPSSPISGRRKGAAEGFPSSGFITLRVHVPKYLVCTLALKLSLFRHFGPKVYTHGPLTYFRVSVCKLKAYGSEIGFGVVQSRNSGVLGIGF